MLRRDADAVVPHLQLHGVAVPLHGHPDMPARPAVRHGVLQQVPPQPHQQRLIPLEHHARLDLRLQRDVPLRGDLRKFLRLQLAELAEIQRFHAELFAALVRAGEQEKLRNHLRHRLHPAVDRLHRPAALRRKVLFGEQLLALHHDDRKRRAQLVRDVARKLLFAPDARLDGVQQAVKRLGERVDLIAARAEPHAL